MLVLGQETVPEIFDGLHSLEFSGTYYSYPVITKVKENVEVFVHDKKENKCVVILSDRYYHTFMQSLGIILQEFKKNNDTHFFILLGAPPENMTQKHILFFIKVLEMQKIKYTVIDLLDYKTRNKCLFIKDFYYYPYPELTDTFVTDLYQISKQHHFDGEPFRKVYCSRRKTDYKTGHWITGDKDPETLKIKDDSSRVSDELALESYLISNGFEIIYPEDFKSFEDQIKYFSSVKTLVSTTGAGLVNMCFMKDRTQVVELTIPMMVQGNTTLHTHYAPMAWAKRLVYFSIPSMRSTEEILKTIESNEILKALVRKDKNANIL
jgi:hypothetical protein